MGKIFLLTWKMCLDDVTGKQAVSKKFGHRNGIAKAVYSLEITLT